MADTLIETVSTNPYESIVADTTTKIWDLDNQIAQLSSAITTLENSNPTSPNLPRLRERLASLQNQRSSLNTQNESAQSLMRSYNSSVQNLSSLRWIFDAKQEQINKEKAIAGQTYDQMAEDTQRMWQNYINALWNATSSENAIINANAWRQWASQQSTAEVRARNYLNTAAAQNEAANQTQQTVNAIKEWKISSDASYTQLSQNNADNYLRQDVMNQFQAQEAEKDRQLQRDLTRQQLSAYSSGSSSSKWDTKGMTMEDYIKIYNSLTDEEKAAFQEWIKPKTDDEEEKK